MKRLIFISSFDYPSRYAHAIHGLYMARAFYEKLGNEFLFFINTSKSEVLNTIPHRLLFGRFGRRIKKMHLRRLLMPFVLLRFFLTDSGKKSERAVFAIDSELIPMLAFFKRLFGFEFIFEIHRILPPSREHSLALAGDKIVFITNALKADFLSRHPEFARRSLVAPEAVNVASFLNTSDEKQELRRELALPEGKMLIGYIGRFEPLNYDKGLMLMISAIRDLPESMHLVLVGGSRDEIAQYAAHLESTGLASRVTLVPHVPSELVPRYAKACDILAYVPPGGAVFFEKETSPMKLFEYMAAKRPTIISDLPTMREILSEDSTFFITPGSREGFLEAVKEIASNTGEAERRVENAFARVVQNTWEARAEHIVALIGG